MRNTSRYFAFVALLIGAHTLSACGGEPPPLSDDDAGRRDAASGCSSDLECDDGRYCNGSERCMGGTCSPGTMACGAGVACDEATDTCGSACSDPDADGDGHDAMECGGDDCDDTNGEIHPGQAEVCDAVDDDCDPLTYGARDADGDGSISNACCNGATCGPDCDDSTIARRPGQLEICDSVDNDCDMSIDEEMNDVPWYPDTDGDLFGDASGTAVVSCVPVPGASLLGTDCDDTRASVSPVGTESCNGRDDDCDGTIDEGCPPTPDAGVPADAGDGVLRTCVLPMGVSDAEGAQFTMNTVGGCLLVPPSGEGGLPVFVMRASLSAGEGPGGGPPPDPIPTLYVEGAVSVTPATPDTAGRFAIAYDTDITVVAQLRDPALAFEYVTFTVRWTQATDTVTVSGLTRADCTTRMGPEVAGVCDGVNSDCDAMADEGITVDYWTSDVDMDGAGSGSPTPISCGSGVAFGWTRVGGDCDDFDPDRSPLLPEVCGGGDEDCDMMVDENPAAAMSCAFPFTTATCSAGACSVSSCTAPYANCDSDGSNGCEANTETSSAHCGGCGMPCADMCTATGCVITPIVDLAVPGARGGHWCVARTSGRVLCTGDNGSGQLGDGTTTSSAIPVAALGITTATAVAAAYDGTCALLSDGTVSCWGSVLGDTLPPMLVPGVTDAVEVDLDDRSLCVRHATGAVSCAFSGSPLMPVPGVTDAVSLSVGDGHACMVRTGGTVLCLGDNFDGQLGDGTTMTRITPRTVVGISDATRVSAGRTTTCAIRAGGAVSCWGRGTSGQLGNGTFASSSSPVGVSTLSGATRLSVGGNYVCAVVGTSLRCWGANFDEFGPGAPFGVHSTPITVSGAGAIADLDCGADRNCVLRVDGTHACFVAGGS